MTLIEIEKINDQSELERIALSDNHYYVRGAATRKLSNQVILEDIAQNDRNSYVRGVAIGRLTNQTVLTHIAKNAKDHHDRKVALNMLDEQAVLIYAAKADSAITNRLLAFEKLWGTSDVPFDVLDDVIDTIILTCKEREYRQAICGLLWPMTQEQYERFGFSLSITTFNKEETEGVRRAEGINVSHKGNTLMTDDYAEFYKLYRHETQAYSIQ